MNVDQAVGQTRPILGLVAVAFALCALGKLFGVDIPIRGTVEQLALVAIAIKHI